MEVSLFSTSQYIRTHTNGSLLELLPKRFSFPSGRFLMPFLIYNFALPLHLKSVSLLKKCVLSGGQIQSKKHEVNFRENINKFSYLKVV